MTVGHELSSRVICFPSTVIVLSASGESRDICRQCPARGDRNRQGATLRVGQHRRRAPLQVTRRSRRITRRSHLPRRAAVATAAAPCSCYGLPNGKVGSHTLTSTQVSANECPLAVGHRLEKRSNGLWHCLRANFEPIGTHSLILAVSLNTSAGKLFNGSCLDERATCCRGD